MFNSYGSGYSQSGSWQAQKDATSAQASAREAKTETELLRHDLDRVLMITEALWTLLKKEHGYADEVLANTVREIDLRDGRLDGRAQPPKAQPCPKCGRMNSAKLPRCLYCGEELEVKLFGDQPLPPDAAPEAGPAS